MKPFDKLWNYNDPAGTEVKFRDVLDEYPAETDLDGHLQLLTQIARTYGLRSMFDEANALLDAIEKQLPAQASVAAIRYNLERGRIFNSINWGKNPEAKPYFDKALQLAKELKEDSYAIDAVHMQAIAEQMNPDKAIELNEAGVLMAEESMQEDAKNWLGSLYNNLGWSYFDRGEYEKALSIFLRGLQWREEKKAPYPIFLAKWSVGRVLRALNRTDDALKIQLGLFEEMINGQADGFVYEELAELYLAKNDPISKMYFKFAHDQLSQDKWLAGREPERIARLLELSK